MIVRELFIKVVKISISSNQHLQLILEFRTLDEAIKDADVFLGLSAKDVVSKEMVKSMARKSNYFCMRKSRSRDKTRTNKRGKV